MKKIVSLALCLAVCMTTLVGCGGVKEVESRDEANRILLSASSTIAECEKVIKDYKTILDDTKMSPENKLSQVKEKDLNNVEKRLDGAYEEIVSCDSFKDVEDVKPKYDSSMSKHEKAMKNLGFLRKDLAKLEESK